MKADGFIKAICFHHKCVIIFLNRLLSVGVTSFHSSRDGVWIFYSLFYNIVKLAVRNRFWEEAQFQKVHFLESNILETLWEGVSTKQLCISGIWDYFHYWIIPWKVILAYKNWPRDGLKIPFNTRIYILFFLYYIHNSNSNTHAKFQAL